MMRGQMLTLPGDPRGILVGSKRSAEDSKNAFDNPPSQIAKSPFCVGFGSQRALPIRASDRKWWNTIYIQPLNAFLHCSMDIFTLKVHHFNPAFCSFSHQCHSLTIPPPPDLNTEFTDTYHTPRLQHIKFILSSAKRTHSAKPKKTKTPQPHNPTTNPCFPSTT